MFWSNGWIAILVRTIRDIKKNQALSVDYGTNYEEEFSFIRQSKYVCLSFFVKEYCKRNTITVSKHIEL